MRNPLTKYDIENAARGDKKPIGLKLTNTQSLLKKMNILSHQPADDASSSSDNRKAVNFPALCLQIGSWQRKSTHEGDLIVKCYFKKSQLIWEFLSGHLKKKIEFEWSNISAIKATFLANEGVLEIKLENPPNFFHEINPEPRKHTNWEVTKDFTDNSQGSLISIHKLKFAPGIFEKFYEHVIRGDPILLELSQRQFPTSMRFKEIKFSSNHHPVELQPQNAINSHSDNQQYLLSQEMEGRIGPPNIEPQIWGALDMGFLGHDVSHDQSQLAITSLANQEGSNGHMLIESETWGMDDMKMLVDAMSNSSTPLTTSGMSPVQHDFPPNIDDHCYYETQFASSSIANQEVINEHMRIEPRIWGMEAPMEFPGHDGSNSLTQFTKRGNYHTHDEIPNNGTSVINSSQFTSSSLTNLEIAHQQLENVFADNNVTDNTGLELSDYPLPQDYLMMVAAQRSGLLPGIQEPHHQVNYNYGNNWGWIADYYHQSSCDYQSQQFYNTGIHGYDKMI